MTERTITTQRIAATDVPASDVAVAALKAGALAFRITDTANPNTVYAVAVPVVWRVGIAAGGDAVWIDDVPAGAELDTMSAYLWEERS